MKTSIVKLPEYVPGTTALFGQEKTIAECYARATWERMQAGEVESSCVGWESLVEAHDHAACEYDNLGRSHELDELYETLKATVHAPNMLGFLRRCAYSIHYREGARSDNATDLEIKNALGSYRLAARVQQARERVLKGAKP